MLQKLVEDRKLLEKGIAQGNYSKNLVNEFDPFFDGSLVVFYTYGAVIKQNAQIHND